MISRFSPLSVSQQALSAPVSQDPYFSVPGGSTIHSLLKTPFIKSIGEKPFSPVMMSLISSAHKKGITFSPEEMSFVLEILKDGKSKEEQAQIDRMVRMVSGYAKRAGK